MQGPARTWHAAASQTASYCHMCILAGVDRLQTSYVRYKRNNEAQVAGGGGWDVHISRRNFESHMHLEQASFLQEENTPFSQNAPESITVRIVEAPAEFAMPVKQDRCVMWPRKTGPMGLPARFRFAVKKGQHIRARKRPFTGLYLEGPWPTCYAWPQALGSFLYGAASHASHGLHTCAIRDTMQAAVPFLQGPHGCALPPASERAHHAPGAPGHAAAEGQRACVDARGELWRGGQGVDCSFGGLLDGPNGHGGSC